MGPEIRNMIQTPASADPGRSSAGFAAGVIADLAAVVIFVSVGRQAHDEAVTLSGVLATGWPFLAGLVGGYLGVTLTRRPALSLRGGLLIAGATVVLGLVLRAGVAGDGAPFSFVVVTIVVLTTLILSWRALILGRRALARAALRRRAAPV
jgi:peptidoglycan/LPS O-acetylase OafA/YrhL